MDSWDPVWEDIFRKRDTWGKYPPEELVRFIAGNYYAASNRKEIKVLEIGCGPGGGPSWYIAREGFSFYGIDGSQTAVAKARQRFESEHLEGEFIIGDFQNLPWPDNTFDCVIDIASLQCNTEAATKLILQDVYRVLKPGGKHFSLTSKNGCWGDGTGKPLDETTFLNVIEGPFADMGVIRFATLESLSSFYAEFRDFQVEYSVRSINDCENEIANWIVTCQK